MGTKRLKPGVLAAAVLFAACGMLVNGAANANGGHGHAHVGVFFGVPGPFYYPAPAYYPYPYYYPAPAVIAPPAEYIEQNPQLAPAPPAAPPAPSSVAPPAPSGQGPSASNNFWYYCPDSQTYYPYVKTCASQWQQVTPRSVPPS